MGTNSQLIIHTTSSAFPLLDTSTHDHHMTEGTNHQQHYYWFTTFTTRWPHERYSYWSYTVNTSGKREHPLNHAIIPVLPNSMHIWDYCCLSSLTEYPSNPWSCHWESALYVLSSLKIKYCAISKLHANVQTFLNIERLFNIWHYMYVFRFCMARDSWKIFCIWRIFVVKCHKLIKMD